jgi:hypothetical protein
MFFAASRPPFFASESAKNPSTGGEARNLDNAPTPQDDCKGAVVRRQPCHGIREM